MTALQKTAGVLALVQAALFILVPVNDLVSRPSQGITGQDVRNPATFLPAVAASPFLILNFVILIGLAITFTVITLALDERLRQAAPRRVRVATACGLGAALLFLADGMRGFTTVPFLASLYAQNPALAGPAYLGSIAVGRGLFSAATFATGWWLVLVGWTALETAWLPKVLAYVGLVFGLVGILTFLVDPLGLVGGILGIIWSLWLGVVLLREREAAPAPAAT